MSTFEESNRYNPNDDTIEWSKIKQLLDIKRQIQVRLIRYKDNELKIQVLHHRLNELNEPEGYNLNRYSIREMDTLTGMLKDAHQELEKYIKKSTFISDILLRIGLK